MRFSQCKLGEAAAKNGDSCTKSVGDFKTESYTDCCEACKIGMTIGPTSDKCQLDFKFGLPWDESLEFCCSEVKDEETYVITEGQNLCTAFTLKLCEHICVNTDDSYYCKCNPGYILQNDQITCAPDPNSDSNEIETPNNDETDCAEGYEYDKKIEQCVDINECETDEAKCDEKTEVCYNQPGKYMCIRIVQANECEDGYRYNTKDEVCEGIIYLINNVE